MPKYIFAISVLTFLLFPFPKALYAQEDAQHLLEEMATKTREIETLYTTFTQEKSLAILAKPLRSSGYMCMEKTPTSTTADTLVWAYSKPQASGFMLQKGNAVYWNGSADNATRVQGAQATILQAMSEHISAWVHINPTTLHTLYTITRKSDTAKGQAVLYLQPKTPQNIFSALEVYVAPTRDAVQKIIFEESGGDSTVLRFATPEINSPLPKLCRITP